MSHARPHENESPPVLGLLAEFDGPAALKQAAAELRGEGYSRFEAYSPFPVHGLYEAMGRRRTVLPRLVLVGGAAGCAAALLLQWWTNAVDYPYRISGKPLFSLPANIPITFELIILLSALATFGGVLVLGRFFQWYHPLFGSEAFRRATTDGFFIAIEADDPAFDPTATTELLRRLGARDVEVYHEPRTERRMPGLLVGGVTLVVALALLPPLWIAKVRYARKTSPRLHLVLDMDFQPKYLPQGYSPLFEDTRDMRPPVAGAVAVDDAIDDAYFLLGQVDGKPAATFPMRVSGEMMRRGQERFGVFCATCHGLAGDGDGVTSKLAFDREEPGWVRPLALWSRPVREQPVGQLFQTISNGIRTMPSYASQIPVDDRWAIVLYVRALQRSRNATIRDVPVELRKHLRE
ncbi:MAG TPA: quinol:electron acceptor oxidoreductase subunit ActD [Thermoguttaceae bacterium]|nr:quinol:electron acceptor oxidoreductase subunit ActD [Thermoguttaceae bacterium]